jgi:hypothetical protein
VALFTEECHRQNKGPDRLRPALFYDFVALSFRELYLSETEKFD